MCALQAENKFKCPCHGSQYNAQGKKIRGPAPLVSGSDWQAHSQDGYYLKLPAMLQLHGISGVQAPMLERPCSSSCNGSGGMLQICPAHAFCSLQGFRLLP